jgi:hypothetical protein
MVVGVMSLGNGDRGSAGAVASSNCRCVGNRGSVAFAHVEIKPKKKRSK